MLKFSPLALFLLLATPVHSQVPSSSFYDQSTRRETVVQLKDATANDFLIAWAKAGNFNVIVDVAQFDEKDVTISGEQKGPLGQLLLNFAAEHKINGRRYDENTFLLWQVVPDDVSTAHLIIERERALMAAAPPPLSKEAMNALLKDYFQRVHGWDGQSTDIDVTVKVAALPPELRERVLVAARDELLAKERRDYAWFFDDLWSKARLHVSPNRQPQQRDALPTRASISVGALTEEKFYGAKQLFYQRRNVLMPQDLSGSTSSKILRAEPIPRLVEPILQPAPEAKLPPVEISPRLSRAQLQDDAALQTPISLENKQLALNDLPGELQKQSGLVFSLAPETATTAQLALRVEKMPLWRVLDALSQLYGCGWQKTAAGGYVLQTDVGHELKKRLFRSKGPESLPGFPSAQKTRDALQWMTDFSDELLDSIDVDEASRDAGIPFSELDSEVQEKIRTRCERMIASVLVRNYQAAQEKLSEDLELNFRAFAPKVPDFARDQAPLTLDLTNLMLTVHLPVDSPYAQIVPAQVQSDLQKRQFSGTLIAHIFPTFPSGQNSDSRSPDGAKRFMERMQQRMKADREVRQNGQAPPQVQPAR